MENTGINDIVLQEICNLAKQYHIEKILLFGSRARGEFHRASDIDLAVWGKECEAFTLALEDTSTLLSYDVIDMNYSLEKKFVESIWKDGVILYEKV